MSKRTTTPIISSLVLAALTVSIVFTTSVAAESEKAAASPNKKTVQSYMEAFAKLDHAAVLSCLTEDVEWIVPGSFRSNGKTAFEKEIENDAFVGAPAIKVTRMIEEKDVVIAEGSVRCARKDGGMLNMVFCDVFEMQNGKIRRLTSYLSEIKE